jgi:Zn-dependent peptidase ImmA (M78 family)
MFSDFAYKYDFAGLYAYRVNVLSPQLADLSTILGVAAMVAVYLALYWKLLPFAYYHRLILAEMKERRRKLSVAQDLIMMKEIQAELEEEMKEELSREAARKMAGHVSA